MTDDPAQVGPSIIDRRVVILSSLIEYAKKESDEYMYCSNEREMQRDYFRCQTARAWALSLSNYASAAKHALDRGDYRTSYNMLRLCNMVNAELESLVGITPEP